MCEEGEWVLQHRMVRPSSLSESGKYKYNHMLNMELDLQSLFGLRVHSCTHWLRPPPHAFGLIYEGAIGHPRKTTSLCDPLSMTQELISTFEGTGIIHILIQFQKSSLTFTRAIFTKGMT
jgi:hypothetical protein